MCAPDDPALTSGESVSHPSPQQSQSLPAVAIVGATGAVGVELIRCLERRHFPLSTLRLFASARSAGQHLTYDGRKLVVESCAKRR